MKTRSQTTPFEREDIQRKGHNSPGYLEEL